MGEQALETFASTKKQKETSGIRDEQDKNTKRFRNSGSENIIFLREKAEKESTCIKEELELKKTEVELQRAMLTQMHGQQQQQS